MVHLAKTVLLDPLAHPVHLAPLVNLDVTVLVATQAVMLKATTLYLVNVVPMENLVVKDPLAHLDLLVKTVNLDNLVPEAHLAQAVKMAKMVKLVTKDLLDHLAKLVKRVSVRNIVLWTVVSSSKMVLGDNRPPLTISSTIDYYYYSMLVIFKKVAKLM